MFIFCGMFAAIQVSTKIMERVWKIDANIAERMYAIPYYLLVITGPFTGWYIVRFGHKLYLCKRLYCLFIISVVCVPYVSRWPPTQHVIARMWRNLHVWNSSIYFHRNRFRHHLPNNVGSNPSCSWRKGSWNSLWYRYMLLQLSRFHVTLDWKCHPWSYFVN